jgi:two-component system LytT family response regulator
MIKTIIVDDEYNAREFLEKMLLRYWSKEFIVLEKCESIDSATKAIQKYKPDLLFLDIQMPSKNGLDLFKEDIEIDFQTILTTAHADYAIKAIKINALDYLLKPINYVDLLSAINRYKEFNGKTTERKNNESSLLKNDLNTPINEKIAITTETGFDLVPLNNILYVEAMSNYSKFHLIDGKKIVTAKTLKYLETLIPGDLFFRIHKSYLVNLNYIARFNKVGEYYIELTNQQKLPISIRKKDDFIKTLFPKNPSI